MRFDLATERWIPVRRCGQPEQVGLRQLFSQAHELSDLDVAVPPAASMLWRVLYVIASRVTALDEHTRRVDDWHERRCDVLAAGRFDAGAIKAYFDRYESRLNLFDEDRPWMQDPRLREECPRTAGVNKLVLSRPSGNNAVFFRHHVDSDPEPVPAGDAVLSMLAWHGYGPSGRCSARTHGSVKAAADTAAGPLRRTISFHPVGDSLFESLVIGLVPPRVVGSGEGDDLAPWERDDLPDPAGQPAPLAGLCSVLTGRSQHALLLVPSGDRQTVIDTYVTWARRSKMPAAEDPYLVMQATKDGSWFPRQADAGRALWRDLDALLIYGGGDTSRQPRVFTLCADLPDDVLDRAAVRSFGFEQDGQTRDKQWFAAVTPPVLRYLSARDPEACGRLAELRGAAESVQSRLRRALRQVWQKATMPMSGANARDATACPWLRPAGASYWAQAERRFWQQVGAGFPDSPFEIFVHLAVHIFDETTSTVARAPRVGAELERSRRLIWSAIPRRAA